MFKMNQLMLQEELEVVRELDSLQVGEKVLVTEWNIRRAETVTEISKNAILTNSRKKFSIKTGNSFKKYSYGADYLIIPTIKDLIDMEGNH